LANAALATPSTNIWNPSTDIQPLHVVHFGIDNYSSVSNNSGGGYSFPTDYGLTYGLAPGLEVGIDFFSPAAHPVQFNAKYGMPERGAAPAWAVGVQNVGTKAGATNYNIAYAVLSKQYAPVGRFTVGGYRGNRGLLVDGDGRPAATGLILAWDRSFGKRWWGALDWATGRSFCGAFAAGASYKFAPNASLILGYVFFRNHVANPKNLLTTQLDIDL